MSDALAGLDLNGLLALLEPVPEPPPVSLWPQTFGWAWLAATVLVVTLWLCRRHRARRRADAYRRAALGELARLKAAGHDPTALAAILRRTALAAYPRAQVASLHGEAWLAFLDATCDRKGFASDLGRTLLRAPYMTPAPGVSGPSSTALIDLITYWVKHHRRQAVAAADQPQGVSSAEPNEARR